VTEGEDKPLKYPHMFRASSIMIINKIDLRPHLDFGVHKAIKNALAVNPNVTHLSSLRAIGSRTLFGSSIAADSARHQGAVRATVDPISEHRDRGFVRHLVGTRTREDQERRQGHRPQNRIDLKGDAGIFGDLALQLDADVAELGVFDHHLHC